MRRPSLFVAIGAIALLFLVVLLWPHSRPTPLPPVVQQALERHQVQSAVDDAHVQELQARARADSARADSAKRIATRAARAAAVARDRADSLAAVARVAHDSGEAWHAAYDARTLERDSLQVALAGEVERGDVLEQQRARSDSVSAIERARRQRADSLVASLVPLAEQREERCRVLHVFGCPSRKAVAIAAAGAGYVIGRGLLARLDIKLPP